jgi:L-asparaginase
MADKPRIVILGTGGTIAGAGASPVDEAYEPGKVATDDLLAAVSGLDLIADIESETLFSLGSEDLGPEQWHKLATSAEAHAGTKGTAGVVITHGTDTLEEAAFFLDAVTKPRAPIVLTAAMRPATALSADGPANINQAVLAATKLAERKRPGIYVVVNGLVLPGWQTVKTNLTLDAFTAYPGGPVARVTRNRLMPTAPDVPSPAAGAFTKFLKQKKPLPQIGQVYLTGGCGTDPLEIWQDKDPAGLVIAGFGGGTMPQAVYDMAYDMAQAGTLIVVSSRLGEPCVLPESARVRRASGMVAAGFLNPQKSALLLGLALASGLDQAQISALFRQFYELPQA